MKKQEELLDELVDLMTETNQRVDATKRLRERVAELINDSPMTNGDITLEPILSMEIRVGCNFKDEDEANRLCDLLQSDQQLGELAETAQFDGLNIRFYTVDKKEDDNADDPNTVH